MRALGVTLILNVADLEASFAWFAKLGWDTLWEYGEPATFGAVGSADNEIFLCLDDQGARPVWFSVWVEDVDAVLQTCLDEGILVIRPPMDEPWGVREMHVRHPDGHVLRVSQALGDDHEHPHDHDHDHDHHDHDQHDHDHHDHDHHDHDQHDQDHPHDHHH